MNKQILESTVADLASQSETSNGVMRLQFDDITMYLIADEPHNRMRIIAPIVEYDTLERQQLDAIMVSNFHRALDARYAVSDGIVYAAFIHSLAELTDHQLHSALIQVANLTASFGSEYSSGTLTYGEPDKPSTDAGSHLEPPAKVH